MSPARRRQAADGSTGWGDLPRSGWPPRLTELQRGQHVALARSTHPAG